MMRRDSRSRPIEPCHPEVSRGVRPEVDMPDASADFGVTVSSPLA